MNQLGYVDAEQAAKDWANTLDLGAASRKVFFGKPRGNNLPRAFVLVKRVGGMPEAEIVPVDDVDLQWDVRVKESKRDAWRIVAALELAIKLLHTGSPLGDTAAAIGTEITLGPVWNPDEDAGYAGYTLGSIFKVRPMVAA